MMIMFIFSLTLVQHFCKNEAQEQTMKFAYKLFFFLFEQIGPKSLQFCRSKAV